jgi:glycosyltransferase involved in cell wall biosynthesis
LIVVIDDASPDNTYQKALDLQEELGSAGNRLMIARLPKNRGVGGAIMYGHTIALGESCDVEVVMAGDDQMDPQYLPALLDPIVDGRADFTKGNRFFSVAALEGMPKYRVIGNAALSFLTKLASGYWQIFDPQNGYTAISSKALRRIPLSKVEQRYDFENDLLIWLSTTGARIIDVNIPARYGAENSTIALGPFIFQVLRTLLRGFARRLWWKVSGKTKRARQL